MMLVATISTVIFYLFYFVKLQSKVQTLVLGLGVDFVFPLSQQQQQQQEEEQQPPPKSIRKGCTRSLKFDTQIAYGLLTEFRGLGVRRTMSQEQRQKF